jgi:UDP-N-acetylmuramate--alanine ligase
LKKKRGLEGFLGTKRRFEKLGEKKGVLLYDDYAHHPREIGALLRMVKDDFKTRRIIVVFQPHTYSRTKKLLREFGKKLKLADFVYLTRIFASYREKDRGVVTSFDLAEKIKTAGGRAKVFDDKRCLVRDLLRRVRRGDLVITMGAGDVYKLGEEIIRQL